jgi:hypothetical protein
MIGGQNVPAGSMSVPTGKYARTENREAQIKCDNEKK